MNINKYKYPDSALWQLQHMLPLFFAVLLLTTACCKKEELISGRTLTFSLDSASLADPDAIREIEVFVFDNQQQLISRTSTGIDGTISLDYPQTPTLHCIAWGNSKDNSLEYSTLQPGDPLEKGYLALTPHSPTRAETIFSNTPPDLFRGAIQIDNSTPADAQPSTRMVMQQTTASIYITIDGLSETTGIEAGEYTVEVNNAATSIDFKGRYSGKTTHRLTGSFNAQKEYIILPFHLFPPVAGQGITIDILHDGKLLESITQMSDKQSIIPVAGKVLKLLISISPSGGVEVSPPGWNPTDIEVNYPK